MKSRLLRSLAPVLAFMILGPVRADTVGLKPRVPSLKFYSCSECHLPGGMRTKPSATKSDHGPVTLRHGKELGKCTTCHDSARWDQLALLTADFVDYNEVQTVCSQCHGVISRDWVNGAHGKTVDGWRGPRTRLTCVECHDPHSPKFPKMKALAMPPFPKFGIPKNHGESKDHE